MESEHQKKKEEEGGGGGWVEPAEECERWKAVGSRAVQRQEKRKRRKAVQAV